MATITGDFLNVEILSCAKMGTFNGAIQPCNTPMMLHVPHEYHDMVTQACTASIYEFDVVLQGSMVHLTISPAKGGRILLHPNTTRGPFRTCELFGGLSGWGYASKQMGLPVDIVVEKHEETARACAMALGTKVVDTSAFMEIALTGDLPGPTVVCGDVSDKLLWSALSMLNVAIIMASPPCQPWSGAGMGHGLSVPDGMIFKDMMQNAGRCRVHMCLVENVAGIVRHPDFNVLVTGAALDGMHLRISGTYTVLRASPVHRDRWLATFIQSSVQVTPCLVQSAQSLTFAAAHLCCPLPGPSLADADALHGNLPHVFMQELQISSEAMRMLESTELIPSWMSQKIDWSKEHPVLSARMIHPSDHLVGVMARYGSQHMLPVEHLRAKGLHTVVLRTEFECRYFSPWEVASALCFPPTVCLSQDLEVAFQQVGNAISVQHALLQCMKTHEMLGAKSPFTCDAPAAVVLGVRKNAIKLSKFEPFFQDGFRCLRPIPNDEVLQAPLKKSRISEEISPTIPFQVEEPVSSASRHLTTEMLAFEPKFVMPKSSGSAAKHPFASGGLITLQHEQKRWMSFAHGALQDNLSTLIVRAMPHAKPEHFRSFLVNGNPVEWNDVVTCSPVCHVIFAPEPMTISCCCEFTNTIFLTGDVTWTVDTVVAMLAESLKCNFNSLSLTHKNLPTNRGDFIAEYDDLQFDIQFHAVAPDYTACLPDETPSKDPGIMPRNPGYVRLVSKHPTIKLTKTACIGEGACFSDAVRIMFPEMVDSMAWRIFVDDVVIDPKSSISGIQSFKVEWNGYRLILPCHVQVAVHSWPVDPCNGPDVKSQDSRIPVRWIRSPFKVKPDLMKFDGSLPIMQIAASYVSHSMLNTNIMCQIGAKIIDPTINLDEIAVDQVLTFKIAPLVGGVKHSFDAVKQAIKLALESHGVDKSQSQDRMIAFTAKADLDALSKVP